MNEKPDNVVELGGRIIENGELAKKRLIFGKAVDIVEKQLDRDALKMEESAIVSEHTIQRRHELMDTARCLRVTQVWLKNLVTMVDEPPSPATEQGHEPA